MVLKNEENEVTHRLRKLHADVGGFGVLLMLCHDWERDGSDGWIR